MKIVIINGSARKGNTLTAINAFIKGADEKNEPRTGKHRFVAIYRLHVFKYS